MKTEIERGLKPRIENKELVPETIPADFAANKGQWLVETAQRYLGAAGASYALIHADDGVIWAKVTGNQLVYPPATDWTPLLRSTTIQQCRIFGDKGELFLWREAEGQWRGRIVIEEQGDGCFFEEQQVLYGSCVHDSQPAPAGFTPIFEPTTGIRQIVPLQFAALKDGERVTLTVVNYLDADKDNQARIFCSRLKTINQPAVV